MSARDKKPRPPRWSSCVVADFAEGGPRLWKFGLSGTQVIPQGELAGAALPRGPLKRGWRQLFQPQLNLAWLPPDQVYLRVLRLPAGDDAELRSMLELQIEKLSPLPVNQIVWGYEVLDVPDGDGCTLVVVVASRTAVETYLGQLEAGGFLADRLQIPLLHQVVADPPSGTVARLHFQVSGSRMLCLTTWWQEGRIESLDLICVPDSDPGAALLIRHLTHQAWAGEMEGWLRSTPQWELVLEQAQAARWQSAIQGWTGQPCALRPALAPAELARLSAQRVADRRFQSNLLPQDHAARYRQQFVDRLWMRGLAAVVALYLLGVLGYAAAVQIYGYRGDSLRRQASQLAPAYTNALVLGERLRVFQEQAALKYAALDCLLAVSERLPHVLTLETFNFQGGDRLFVAGTVGTEDQSRVNEFNADLRRAQVGGQLLFAEDGVQAPKITSRGADAYRWDFTAKLNNPWLE